MPNESKPTIAPSSSAQAMAAAMHSVLAALNNYNDEIKLACAEASLEGEFPLVERLARESRRMDDVKREFAALSVQRNQGHGDLDHAPVESPAPENSQIGLCDLLQSAAQPQPSGRRRVNGTRTSGTLLKVELNGRAIRLQSAAATFVEALRLIGFDRISQLGITLSGIPLVSREDRGS
jgi:hypothetical protein